MRIAGLQKVSVVDYPGKISCIIFLHGCNFRCGFCYNPDLVVKEFGDGFGEDYVLNFLKRRVGKLDGVCITGGEPLMTLNLDFLKKIKDLGYNIKLDTNGSFPEKLKEIIDAGLVDYIAMDIKNSKKKYKETTGVNVDLKKIENSIKLIHNFSNYEFRMTVVERLHDKKSVVDAANWLKDICGKKPKRFFLQGFKRNEGGMIDSSYSKENNTDEKFLEELKNSVKDYFGDVGIRI